MIQELRREHDLTMLLEIAQLPKATFYYHRKNQDKQDKYAQAKAEITAIFHENKGRYGYGVTTDYLLCLTDDPHRQPAATDDLGLSAKAEKKTRNLQRCSSNEREYMDFLNLVLGSDLFDHFLYALYVDVHVHLSELIYKSVATSSSDTQHAEIR